MTYEKTDAAYREEIDQFSAYLSLKESNSLIEGFFSSGQLLRNLKLGDNRIKRDNLAVGLTGSIGRREAHTLYSDYDVAVIARSREERDSVMSCLFELNPQAHFERSELFGQGAAPSEEHELLKDIYYPLIDPNTIRQPDALMARVWLLTEFIPLETSPAYVEVQETLANHYQVFTQSSLYAQPKTLLDDLLGYRHAFRKSMEKTQHYEKKEMRGMGHYAKTIILRRFAHLFNTLAVVRMVCRKHQILSLPGEIRNAELFANLRAPTLIRIGYWFSDEFHFSKAMRRFDAENELSSTQEVSERYLTFLRTESPPSRGKVIEKLCLSLKVERGLVRRLFKRTCVELIENYNEGLKRIWEAEVRDHLAKVQPGPSMELEGLPEILNMKELAQRVLWPLYALSKLISITFDVAGEWGYFEGETYPNSGRAESTKRLLEETKRMSDRDFKVP